jgi:uncharacterized protein with NAD-binding domain and iron-sulfur cluster
MGEGCKPKIVILGGGMGGLATAWELSRGRWRDRFAAITVYQRGWRLGGKGASSRGPHGRIEEHGLHILLGYYDATFRMVEECYRELDRPTTDPQCPIATWDDAVKPSGLIGLADATPNGWSPWITEFTTTGDTPGGTAEPDPPLDLLQMTIRSLRLLVDFQQSLASGTARPAGPVTLSASPQPPRTDAATQVMTGLRGAGLTAAAVALELIDQAEQGAAAAASRVRVTGTLHRALRTLRDGFQSVIGGDPASRRMWELIDLVTTNLRGIIADRLLTHADGLAAINDVDYRQWLRRHGAAPETVDCAIVRGMYDLVFAYEDGDPGRPRFAAGLGLELATRMLLGHRGAIFWKMQAGMGEVVFAPLYQVLARRGVEFRFFHRVDNLRLGDAGASIAAIELGRQAEVTAGAGNYRPLVDVGGLPCWPDRPLIDQLVDGDAVHDAPLESHWCERDDRGSTTLVAGEDFDVAVFAISLGMIPYVCRELIERSPRWRAMVERVGTVATQSFQIWLRDDERALGWPGPEGVTLSGFAEPFDTWASMNHLLSREQWPSEERPRTIAYFCSALGGSPVSAADAAGASETVRAAAIRFLETDLPALWPGAVDASGAFRWERLVGADGEGAERFDGQYWRANVDPSDRYVQSLPGTDSYRLPPGDTGFDNLVVAGDWTDCGLNAGCVEAATRSGILAARAVAGRHTNREG